MRVRQRNGRIAPRRSARWNPAAPSGSLRKIVRVLEVVDTRQYEEVADGVFKPVPDSGSPHTCSRCGRTHEVHALVELDDGTTELVGTGCASKASMDVAAQVKTEMARQKNLDKWTRVLASLERRKAAWDAAVASVKAMHVPPVECLGPAPNERKCMSELGMFWRCGDAVWVDRWWGDRQKRAAEYEAKAQSVTGWERNTYAAMADDLRRREYTEAQRARASAEMAWRDKRLAEATGGSSDPPPNLDNDLSTARRKVKALRAEKA